MMKKHFFIISSLILILFYIQGCSNRGKHPIYLFKKFGRASNECYARYEELKANKVDTIIFLSTMYETGIKEYSLILYKINGIGYFESYYDAHKKFKAKKAKKTILRNKYNEDFRVYHLPSQPYDLDSMIKLIKINLDTLKQPKKPIPDIVGIGGGTFYEVKIGIDSFECSYFRNFIERYPNSVQIYFVKSI